MALPTVDEIVRLRRISSISVRRYIPAGKLPAVRVGRSVRIEQAEVERFATLIGHPVAGLSPVASEGHIFTFDSPLWDLVGTIEEGPEDLAENHDKYLADAYADLHDQ
jgi:excisionase family DNA binding protein